MEVSDLATCASTVAELVVRCWCNHLGQLVGDYFYGGGVQRRYRYRINPTPDQIAGLARVFGCCRVVFNDALRVRQEAYNAGVTLSDSEIQRQVITVAKKTEQRAWLADVSSVALVQSVNDSRLAFRNFFASCTGQRRGRKAGRPRMKSKRDSRQSFRLARTGFRLRSNGRLYLAKIGDVRVRWSRDLPSEPSSVTIIREPDGKYYASFVVDVPPTPLPEAEREAGVDVGIARLATIIDTDGVCTSVPNPRHLQRKIQKLRRLERQKSRREKGSNNREKSRRKGMVRNKRLARAICDAGWAQLVRVIGEKAEKYGRAVQPVSRWLPSSKACSACGHVLDDLPLRVRQWACPVCQSVHDRDQNAAKNILAAGRAERLNACGVSVSPRYTEVRDGEAGSTTDAA